MPGIVRAVKGETVDVQSDEDQQMHSVPLASVKHMGQSSIDGVCVGERRCVRECVSMCLCARSGRLRLCMCTQISAAALPTEG